MKLINDNIHEDITLRISKIREIMSEADVSAILIASNVNIYYTTGRFFRGYVYIPLEKDPIWFIVKPNVFQSDNSIIAIRKPELIAEELIKKDYPIPSTLGLEFDDLSYSEITRLKKIFPETEIRNASSIMKRARMIKTNWEIEQMKLDGIHHTNVYKKISQCFKPGMTDLRFQIEIEKELRLEGVLGVSRVAGNLMDINMGSVVSGENADSEGPYEFTMTGEGVDPSLPVGANGSEIKKGTTVMVDMNGLFNGYQTDMTRVWAYGDLPEQALKAHECSRRILHELEILAKPGVPVAELYRKAEEIVKEEGLSDYFMGHKNKVAFIGHGVGIELNELPVVTPRSKDILSKNMTIALEPKFVIPQVGAIGIENTYVVTDSGLQNITLFPEEIQKLG